MIGKVYLAGSIPKSKNEKEGYVDWRKDFEVELNKSDSGVVILDPNTADYDSMPTEKFFGRDVHMIQMSDALVIDARQKTDLGTSQEFMVAKYYNKPTIVISNKGSHYNKIIKTNKSDNFNYIHPFLMATSDVIVEDINEAVKVLLGHISGNKIITPKSIHIIEDSRKDYVDNFMKFDEYVSNISDSK